MKIILGLQSNDGLGLNIGLWSTIEICSKLAIQLHVGLQSKFGIQSIYWLQLNFKTYPISHTQYFMSTRIFQQLNSQTFGLIGCECLKFWTFDPYNLSGAVTFQRLQKLPTNNFKHWNIGVSE